jgi:hypothetical protein
MSHPRGSIMRQCQVGCPIRRSEDQSPFPAPLCLSQGITSFIASCCQGIHQTPFSRLIRSRDGQGLATRARAPVHEAPFCCAPRSVLKRLTAPALVGKSYILPLPGRVRPREHSVSVLDLDTDTASKTPSRRPQDPPHSEDPAVLMLLFLHNVMPSGSDGTALENPGLADAIQAGQNGGAWGDRTPDPLLAKQVLSQLS